MTTTGIISEMALIVMEVVIYMTVLVTARYLVPYIKTKMQSSKYEFLAEITEDAVHAIEQLVKEPKAGKKKKDLVFDYVIQMAERHNIPIGANELEMLIEAAVKAMNDYKIEYKEIEDKPEGDDYEGFLETGII